MMPLVNLKTIRSLDDPERSKIESILNTALNAVDPIEAINHYVNRDGKTLQIGNQSYNLSHYEQVILIGAGKASQKMSRAMGMLLGDYLTGGAIISKASQIGTKKSSQTNLEYNSAKIRDLFGMHPIPDETSLESTQQLLKLLKNAGKNDLVICLISGGASALFTAPMEGVSLSDLQSLTSQLLACGASIGEINTIRKHLDRVKGGGVARMVYPAQLVSLILSDVVGSPIDVIASGPTVADDSTFSQAIKILDRYELLKDAPEQVTKLLKAGSECQIPETLKSGDDRLQSVQNIIIASNQLACEAAYSQSKAEGLNGLLLTSHLVGEARHAGGFLAAILQQMAELGQPVPRPGCVIAGGETTVTITGNGKGGRNQELALSTVELLDSLQKSVLVSLATDGEDGPTDSAGAVVTGESYQRASMAGLDPQEYLDNNNSYEFFDRLGDNIKTGPTGTNVNDLTLLFSF
jgi:glycerate 2-kinase